MAMFIGNWEFGVWFSALHEISYFIIMGLFFLLPCDFFEVDLICVCVVLFCPSVSHIVSHSMPSLNS